MTIDQDVSGHNPLPAGHCWMLNTSGKPILRAPVHVQHGTEVQPGQVFALPTVDAREWVESGIADYASPEQVAAYRQGEA